MSFDKRFDTRFEQIYRPAIEDEPICGAQLKAFRVDNSQTGDSILTEIVDGIAHSRLVLADVSVIDQGRFSNTPVRNANVMYEVGIALACRMPSEVLLVRDDSDRFLFDVSTIPHMHIDVADLEGSITRVRAALESRIRESNLIDDARIELASEVMTAEEIDILEALDALKVNESRHFAMLSDSSIMSGPDQRGIDGLIAKGCVRMVVRNAESGAIYYALNKFGRALAASIKKSLRVVKPAEPKGDGQQSEQ